MKNRQILTLLTLLFLLGSSALAQGTIVINDPTANAKTAPKIPAEESLIRREVLPKARQLWAGSENCEEDFGIAGVAWGAFSKPKSEQTLVFYEFCQTGNGFGNNGLVLIENGRILASYVAEGGWAIDLNRAPDVNGNGLDEFLVYYSGGLHQGAGGTGVDLMEFSGVGVKGLGWFQSDSYGEETGNFGYKVSVKPGKIPIFYREKFLSVDETKWRKSGKLAPFKLGKPYGKFTVLK